MAVASQREPGKDKLERRAGSPGPLPSARVSRRPLYHELAWAYDQVSRQPVQKQVAFIADQLAIRGVLPPQRVLDAGCGSGRHALALAQRGFAVIGLDTSPDLLAEARRKVDSGALPVLFALEDVRTYRSVSPFDAVLARGLLDEAVDEGAARQMFTSLAAALRPRGVLILDVPDWTFAQRQAAGGAADVSVQTERGLIRVRRDVDLDQEKCLMTGKETVRLRTGTSVMDRSHRFAVRCWTKPELRALLAEHGFGETSYMGAYGPEGALRSGERIVVIARRAG